MRYDPVTSFRRPVEAGQLTSDPTPLPAQGVNKWESLREIGTARLKLGVTDREIGVLQALLSFYPDTILGGNRDDLVVFPSNAAICERLNGMACSTMRRHLAGLVRAGLVERRDSPNGKRFCRQFRGEREAFGFDLTPLARRHSEICALAEEVRAETEAYERLRRAVSLMRRDLAGVVAFGEETRPAPLWDRLGDLAVLSARALRRKISMQELQAMAGDLTAALDESRAVLNGETGNMSTNDAVIEQQYQNSNKDLYGSEPCLEEQEAASVEPENPNVEPDPYEEHRLPNLPLPLVLSVCTEIRTYVPDPLRHWHDLVRAAEIVRPMMGISQDAWDNAISAMGPEEASVVVLAMLERMEDIARPGGYLRALTDKAEAGAFSCGPMVMALMRRAA